jgi:hypothetical protein
LVVLGYKVNNPVDPVIISFVLVIGWEEDFGATERLSKEEDFVHCRGLAAVGLETNPEYTTRRKTPDKLSHDGRYRNTRFIPKTSRKAPLNRREQSSL